MGDRGEDMQQMTTGRIQPGSLRSGLCLHGTRFIMGATVAPQNRKILPYIFDVGPIKLR